MKKIIQEKTELLTVLHALSPDSSKTSLKSWVEQGRVSVNERLALSWRQEVLPGQEVVVGPRIAFAEEGLKILYEDRDLVVLEKPEKLLSVATVFEHEQTVHGILKRRLGKMVYPVHRLDRDTSGIMLFTYNIDTQEALKEQFEKHTIERVYLGLVEGIPSPPQGTWKSFLSEDDFYYVKSGEAGKLAITHYEVLHKRKKSCLVKFTIETGRKNQIRVHASEGGHPIVGDTKYGAQTLRKKRLFLHAHILGFFHPMKKKQLRFVSPLPTEFV